MILSLYRRSKAQVIRFHSIFNHLWSFATRNRIRGTLNRSNTSDVTSAESISAFSQSFQHAEARLGHMSIADDSEWEDDLDAPAAHPDSCTNGSFTSLSRRRSRVTTTITLQLESFHFQHRRRHLLSTEEYPFLCVPVVNHALISLCLKSTDSSE